MIRALFPFAKPLLHAIDPETAHRLTIKALALAPASRPPIDDPRLAIAAFGRRFPNPVGLAAGFDKQGEAPDALLALGFGFVELGGVVPLPQPGNPRPRLFRLPRDEAVINRFGLNSDGLEAIRGRLALRRGRPGIVGVNIGANKLSADRVADYVASVQGLCGLVDFLTVNVSSPNTPGLRDLQEEAVLDELLARCVEARESHQGHGTGPAILLKIAPDIVVDALDGIAKAALARGIDGLMVSNTTLDRPKTLQDTALAREAGGLSGRPLFAMSTRLLAQAFLRLDGKLPLIGVGGVDSAEAAWAKIRAGATLVQLYTALIYRGPAVIQGIKQGLLDRLAREGLDGFAEAIGRDAGRIAAGDLT